MFVSGFLDSPFLLWVFVFLFFFLFHLVCGVSFSLFPPISDCTPSTRGLDSTFSSSLSYFQATLFSLIFFFLCESFRQLFGSGATLRFLSPRPCSSRSSPGYVVGYESDRVSRTSSSEPRFVVPPARFSTCGCVGYSIRLCNVASPVPLAYILL